MRLLIVVSLVLLLSGTVASAQGSTIGTKAPKRAVKVASPGLNVTGGFGSNYQPPAIGGMPFPHRYPFNSTTAIGGIGTYHRSSAHLYHMGGTHNPMFPSRDPWWFLREWEREPKDLRDLLGGGNHPVLMSPNQLLLRQLHNPMASSRIGLLDMEFLFPELPLGAASVFRSQLFDLGMPSMYPFGASSSYGLGNSSSRVLSGGYRPNRIMPYSQLFYSHTFYPDILDGMGYNRRSLLGPMNYGMPSYPMFPGGGIGGQPWRNPYLPVPQMRPIVRAPQAAPKPAVAKALTEPERMLLKGFARDLGAVVEAARNQRWAQLDTAIRKLRETPDLPDTLNQELKDLDAAAKEIAGGRWLADVLNECTALERAHAEKHPKQGFARLRMTSQFHTLVGQAVKDHVECRGFELQVLAADIENTQKLVVRLAEAVPLNKEVAATPAAVEKLLGRTLTGVETLVLLHMRADQRSAQDIAAELRKAR